VLPPRHQSVASSHNSGGEISALFDFASLQDGMLCVHLVLEVLNFRTFFDLLFHIVMTMPDGCLSEYWARRSRIPLPVFGRSRIR
jgi:hypothetical protein